MVRINVINKKEILNKMFYVFFIIFIVFAISKVDFFKSMRNQKIENINLKFLIDSSLNLSTFKVNKDTVNKNICLLQDGTSLFTKNVQVTEDKEIEEIKEDNEIEETEEKKQYIVSDGVDYSNVGNTINVCNVKIKNGTNYSLNENELNSDLSIFKDKNISKILIVHTHTSECYTPTEGYDYIASGNFRTQNENCNVINVGKNLKSDLEKYNFNVIHDTTYHDYPKYNGSYTRSLETVEKNIENDKNIEIVIDLHRDAVSNNDGFRPIANFEEKSAAQLMFVVGTSGGGLAHNDWKENLKLAIKIQSKANEMYPRFI